MPKGKKLTKVGIRWSRRNGCWEAIRTGSPAPFASSAEGITKAVFIRHIVYVLCAEVDGGAYGFSLRIKNKDGEYVSERTIPRSADPRKSKG